MNIQFDTDITQPEARGIILLLTALFPALSNSNPVIPSTPPAILPEQPTPADAPIHVAEDAAQQTETHTGGPTLVAEPSTRKRRTKAEIAADEAAAKQASTPTAEPTLQTAVEATTAEPAAPVKPPTAEELRALFNDFIARQSMDAAITLLKDFGCQRINEALALPAEKLIALADKARG